MTTITQYLGDSVTHRIGLSWAGQSFEPGTSWGLIFTAKANVADTDAQAKIQKATGLGIAVEGAAALIALVPDDTEDLTAVSLYWDVQAQHFTSGEVRTVAAGVLALSRDVTRQTTTSVPVVTTEPPFPGGNVAGDTHEAAEKAVPADNDEIPLVDSAASWSLKRLKWSALKAALKTYFDPLYQAAGVTWSTLSGKPSTFAPSAHKSSHATGGSDPLTPADIGAQPAGDYAPATGIAPEAVMGTAVVTDDSRLSDDRTPLAHSGSHAIGGSDELTPADIGAQPAGDYAPASGIAPSAIAGTAVVTSDSRLGDARAPLPHTHGNISNAGTIGSTSGLPLITGTAGLVQVGSFGSTAGTFCQGNDSRLSNERVPTDNSATNAKLADMPGGSIKGRSAGAGGDPEDLAGASLAPILGVAFNAGTEDTTPADADRVAVVSPAGGWLSLSRLWDYVKGKLDTALTIAGAKTLSGQLQLTGQSATDANSAMTRGLVEALQPFGSRRVALSSTVGLLPLMHPRLDTSFQLGWGTNNVASYFWLYHCTQPFQKMSFLQSAGTHPTAEMEIGVYNIGAGGMPSTLIQKGSVSLATTGIKTVTLASPVVPNGLFFVVMRVTVGNTNWIPTGGSGILTVLGPGIPHNFFQGQITGCINPSALANFSGTLVPTYSSTTPLPADVAGQTTLQQISGSNTFPVCAVIHN